MNKQRLINLKISSRPFQPLWATLKDHYFNSNYNKLSYTFLQKFRKIVFILRHLRWSNMENRNSKMLNSHFPA